MAVVKINAIDVPEGAGPELEKRFAARQGAVEGSKGFLGFELLRPVSGETRYFDCSLGCPSIAPCDEVPPYV